MLYKDIDPKEYFERESRDRVICKLCRNSYSAIGTLDNLKMHVFKRHAEKLGLIEAMPVSSPRIEMSMVWKYYDRNSGDDSTAICILCSKAISHKTTTGNLRTHLVRSHGEAYIQMLQNIKTGDDEDITSGFTDNGNDSDEGDQIQQEIWNYFEQETGGRVRCVVCRASKPNNNEEMKNHIEEVHPKLLQATTEGDTLASDQESNKGDDDETYTEVIYVEEEPKKTPKFQFKKEKPFKRRLSTINRSVKFADKKQRRDSTSSDEMQSKKNSEGSEIDTFLTYIKCLLSQLPRHTCAKLQLDIVNLIMNVKLSKSNAIEQCFQPIMISQLDSERNRVEGDSSNVANESGNHSYTYADTNNSEKVDES